MTPELAPHVRMAETSQGTVLLDTHTGHFWQLNPTATVVLRHLADSGGIAAAIDELTADYPESADRVRADVEALIEQLRQAKLVSS